MRRARLQQHRAAPHRNRLGSSNTIMAVCQGHSSGRRPDRGQNLVRLSTVIGATISKVPGSV